jgi:adenosylhomocysteine nucleosidase
MPHLRSPAPSCCLGIIFALPIEAHSFERSVTGAVSYQGPSLRIWQGTCGDRSVAWAVSGVGEAAAARAAQLIIDGHRPRRLVSAGFAGGLDSRLTRGKLVLPTRLLDGSGRQRPPLTIDRELTEVVADVASKLALHQATGAGLVDMESYAVAEVAASAGLGAVVCRVISDAANEALPREVKRLGRPQSTMHRLGAAIGAIGRRPRAVIDFWKLWEQSLAHSQVLADGLGDLIRAV